MKTPLLKVAALLLLCAVVYLNSCKEEPSVNPLDELPDEQLLNIPTYDGSGQCVHPDILFMEPRSNGYRYVMAFTPYPYFDDKLENPSLVHSNNGVDFTEVMSGMNPLAKAPQYDHNDDPDLRYDPVTGKYYLYYLETMRPDSQNVIVLESTDGLTFTKHTAVHFDLTAGDPFILSPAVIRQPDGHGYRMYFVYPVNPYRVQYIYSADGEHWDKHAIKDIETDLQSPYHPWHMDVIHSPKGYAMLCNCIGSPIQPFNQVLMLGTSTDGDHWHFQEQPLMVSDPHFHGCRYVYRSTGLWFQNKLAVWYSMVDTNSRWMIGIKKFDTDTIL